MIHRGAMPRRRHNLLGRGSGAPAWQRVLGAIVHLAGARAERSLSIAMGLGSSYTYSGSRMSRLEQDWITNCVAADEEIKRDGRRLRSRARDLARNNPLAKNFFRLDTNYTIGARGPRFEPRVLNNDGKLARPINSKIREYREQWARRVSLDCRKSEVQFKRLMYRTAQCDGQAFARIWRGQYDVNQLGLALEPIDADQLDDTLNITRTERQNEIRMGIEFDRFDRRVAYHCYDRPYSWAYDRNRIRIPAKDMIHVYNPDRMIQSQGVTALHAATLALHFLGEYLESELVRARERAAQPIIWVRKDGAFPGEETDDPSGEPRHVITEIEPGMTGFAPEGYMPANIPFDSATDAFVSFVQGHERQVASALGWSCAELTENYADINLSSQRSSRRVRQVNVAANQQWFETAYELPLHDEFMTEALLLGEATGGRDGLRFDQRDPERYRAARWLWPGDDYMDPLKDATADAIELAWGLNSRQRITAARGDDLYEILRERGEEQEWADELGVSIVDASMLTAQAAELASEKDDTDESTSKKRTARARRGATHVNGNGLVHANRVLGALLEEEDR